MMARAAWPTACRSLSLGPQGKPLHTSGHLTTWAATLKRVSRACLSFHPFKCRVGKRLFPSLSPSTGEDARGGRGEESRETCVEAHLSETPTCKNGTHAGAWHPGEASKARGGHAMWTALLRRQKRPGSCLAKKSLPRERKAEETEREL